MSTRTFTGDPKNGNFSAVVMAVAIIGLHGCDRSRPDKAHHPVPAAGESTGDLGDSLPSNYLLTVDDFQDFVLVKDEIRDAAAKMSRRAVINLDNPSNPARILREALQTTLTAGMAIPALKPGRTLDLEYIRRTSASLSTNGRSIYVTTQIIGITSAAFLAPVCHEIGHTVQNHWAERLLLDQNTRYREADEKRADAIAKFLAATYDKNSSTLTWNAAAYRNVTEAIQLDTAVLDLPHKRIESIADIAGAMICAQWGVAPTAYRDALKSAFAQLDALDANITYFGKTVAALNMDVAKATLQDGQTAVINEDDAKTILLPIFQHPTYDERAAQITRLLPMIMPHYDSTSRIGADFSATYNSLAPKAVRAFPQG